MPENPSVERFVEELEAYRWSVQREKYRRYFKTGEGQCGEGDVFIGVRMGQVFAASTYRWIAALTMERVNAHYWEVPSCL